MEKEIVETNEVQDVPAEVAPADKMPLLYAALAKAQGGFAPIAKNRAVKIQMKGGGAYEFRYADLEAILSATRPALAANGLAVFQRIEPIAGTTNNNLITVIAHKDGGLLESVTALPAGYGGDLKSFGANLSYLRRYAYTSLLCVSADDDLDEDGQPAGNSESQKEDPSKALAAIASAKTEDALKTVFADAWAKYQGSRVELKAAYDERKAELDKLAIIANQDAAIEAAPEESNHDDVPGV